MNPLSHGTSILHCRLFLGVVFALATCTIFAQDERPFNLPGLALPALAAHEHENRLDARQNEDSSSTSASGDTLVPSSGGDATRVSVLGTVIPVGTGILILKIHGTKHDTELPVWLIASGVFVGPSLGYIVEGEVEQGIGGVAIRTGIGVAFASVALVHVMNSVEGGPLSKSAIAPLLYTGSLIIVGHAAYDVLNAGSYIKERREERRRSVSVAVLPTYDPDTQSKGLAVQLAF